VSAPGPRRPLSLSPTSRARTHPADRRSTAVPGMVPVPGQAGGCRGCAGDGAGRGPRPRRHPIPRRPSPLGAARHSRLWGDVDHAGLWCRRHCNGRECEADPIGFVARFGAAEKSSRDQPWPRCSHAARRITLIFRISKLDPLLKLIFAGRGDHSATQHEPRKNSDGKRPPTEAEQKDIVAWFVVSAQKRVKVLDVARDTDVSAR
jgi:hypothetical protein